MAGKLPKRTRPRLGNCPPSNAELVKSNRIRRRSIARSLLSSAFNDGLVPKPRLPPVPVVTFFLSLDVCKVSGTAILTRERQTQRSGHGWKAREFTAYGKWRPMKDATQLLAGEISPTATYIGIKAPLTSWAATGMLDGLVLRDIPKEARQGRFDRPGETTKRAA